MARVLEEAEECIDTARAAGLRFPESIAFACGAFAHLGRYANRLTARGPVLVVAGQYARDHGLRAVVEDQFCGQDVPSIHYVAVHGEPTCESVDRHVRLARRIRPQLVVGIGGGSAIDTAKAIAALLTNEGSVQEYLEGDGRVRRIECAPAQTVAVPTTAGTGAEMTRNAVLGCPDRRVKRSLRDDRLIPAMALIDPELTRSLPREATISGGLDALTQLVEVCISRWSRPDTTALALRALRFVREALPLCVERPDCCTARAAMSMAASVSGICLANSGLGMAHGIAAALGAAFELPHGLTCGVLLPHVLRFNREAAAEPLGRAMAAFLDEPEPTPNSVDRGLAALDDLYRRLGVPSSFASLTADPETLERLAEASMGRSMSGNPAPVTRDDVRSLLAGLMGT